MKRIKGMLYDVGRDLRGDEKYYQELIKRLADYGYNMILLNLEYRFFFPSHPEIGMPDSLTPDIIQRLDKFARSYNIELVPFMNCAGHCNGIGMTEKYNHLCLYISKKVKINTQTNLKLTLTVQMKT